MGTEAGEWQVDWVFVTTNTEYYVRHNACIAVRDAETGEWMNHHFAVGSSIEAGLGSGKKGLRLSVVLPQVGHRLLFDNGLLTSPISLIRRMALPVSGRGDRTDILRMTA